MLLKGLFEKAACCRQHNAPSVTFKHAHHIWHAHLFNDSTASGVSTKKMKRINKYLRGPRAHIPAEEAAGGAAFRQLVWRAAGGFAIAVAAGGGRHLIQPHQLVQKINLRASSPVILETLPVQIYLSGSSDKVFFEDLTRSNRCGLGYVCRHT